MLVLLEDFNLHHHMIIGVCIILGFLFPNSDPQGRINFLDRRKKDMSDCGMDFVIGESDDPEVNLCLEKKGWYLEGGPICEEKTMWNRPACIQWRKKHSKPDAKPLEVSIWVLQLSFISRFFFS